MNPLTLTIALPLAGALLTGATGNRRLAQTFALACASLELLASLRVLAQFQADQEDFQLVAQYTWIPSLHSQIALGVDGISVVFIPITALLFLLAIIASWHQQSPRAGLQLALLLTLEALTQGMYSALDLLWFYACWQLALPVIFFLIGLWGLSPTRRSTASKCFLFMMVGGAPLLLAVLLLAVNHATQNAIFLPERLSFNLPELLATPLADSLQTWVFLLLLAAFTVKAPLVPLHTWLPSAAMDGPAQLTALLAGLNLGGYGIIRLAMSLAPAAAVEYNWILGIIGAVTLIYAALIALRQSNLRRFLAFASISQAGLALIGIASLNMQGIQGGLCQLFNLALTGGCLMLITGMLQQRLGSTEQCHAGGLAQVMPRLGGWYLLFALASAGLPLSSGFPAELLIILGGLTSHPSLGIIALLGVILTAAITVSCYRRFFLGPVVYPPINQLADLRLRENGLLMAPALLLLAVGLWPNSLLEINKTTAQAWLTRLLEQPGMEGEGLALNQTEQPVSKHPR